MWSNRPLSLRLIVIALMCLSFTVSWSMELHLFDLRTLFQVNVWFQADPDVFMSEFIDVGGASLRHPNSGLFVGAPIAIGSWVIRHLGLGGGPAVRTWLILLVAPIAGALRTLAMFSGLRRLTRNLLVVVALCLLDIVAFETVALGSIPESYPLSAACIAGMYWLMMSTSTRAAPLRAGRWMLAGTIATGITLTNLFPFAVLLGTTLLRRRVRAARLIATTITLVLAVVAANGVAAVSRIALAGRSVRTQLDAGSTTDFLHWPSVAVAQDVLWAVSHALLAPRPGYVSGHENQTTNPDYDFEVKYEAGIRRGLESWWRAGFTMLVFTLGVAGFMRRRVTRLLFLAPVTILMGNVVLHCIWGRDIYLYGLHWEGTMVWIIAGIAFLSRPSRSMATAMLGAFVLITALNSCWLARELLAYLSSS